MGPNYNILVWNPLNQKMYYSYTSMFFYLWLLFILFLDKTSIIFVQLLYFICHILGHLIDLCFNNVIITVSLWCSR